MKPINQSELSEAVEVGPADLFGVREERRLVELTGYVIRPDNSIVDVKVVDLSYDGCAVRTLTKFAKGEKVKLSVLGRGALNAVVRWYGARKAGLLFLPEKPDRSQSPRKAERIKVKGELSLRRAGGIPYRVRLFDLTRFGCKCEFVQRPKIQEQVWIKFEGVESVEAAVIWMEESTIGVTFSHPFHEAVFDMLLHRLETVA